MCGCGKRHKPKPDVKAAIDSAIKAAKEKRQQENAAKLLSCVEAAGLVA